MRNGKAFKVIKSSGDRIAAAFCVYMATLIGISERTEQIVKKF